MGEAKAREEAWQASVFRDIVGNPYHPVRLMPSWASAEAVRIAQAIYSQRDFGQLMSLRNALLVANCQDIRVLQHCVDSTPHVRGCWVVDLLLGHET